MFNAETLIVGFVSGAIGIGASLLLNLVVNYFVHKYTGLTSIQATLPLAGGLILVCISMLLTWIAGLIPPGLPPDGIPSRHCVANNPGNFVKTG